VFRRDNADISVTKSVTKTGIGRPANVDSRHGCADTTYCWIPEHPCRRYRPKYGTRRAMDFRNKNGPPKRAVLWSNRADRP